MSESLETSDLSDIEILARTLWGEARGEPIEGKQAVASVIMNRAKNPIWWGNSVLTVCLKPSQFSCWLKSDPNREKLLAVTKEDDAFRQCLEVAWKAVNGSLPDNTHGADSYQVVGTNAYWSKGLHPIATIGHHEFFKTA